MVTHARPTADPTNSVRMTGKFAARTSVLTDARSSGAPTANTASAALWSPTAIAGLTLTAYKTAGAVWDSNV